MRAELLKSTPFRMTLLLSAIFLVSLAVAAGSAYQLIRQELALRVDATLTDTFAVISQSYGDNDITDLTASVESHARATLGHDQVFRLVDASGAVIAGNLPAAPVPTGWSTLPAKALGRKLQRTGDFLGQHGLAGAGLSLDQQGFAQRGRGIDGEHQILGGDVIF